MEFVCATPKLYRSLFNLEKLLAFVPERERSPKSGLECLSFRVPVLKVRHTFIELGV